MVGNKKYRNQWEIVLRISISNFFYYIINAQTPNEYILSGKNEFFKKTVYFVCTSDPKLTMFFIELTADELSQKISSNLEFYASVIV